MIISEAVREALRVDGCITLPELEGWVKIRPTDTPMHCIISKADGSNPSKYGWNPQAKDLLREDWLVTA